MVLDPNLDNDKRGERAEQVASWYFRLNGFLSIPGFVVHPDRQRAGARTEADLIVVRFAYSFEEIAGCKLKDDSRLTQLTAPSQKLFILVEIKTGTCNINGPWTDSRRENMQRVIRRLGFVSKSSSVENIAKKMYQELRWEGQRSVMQYIAVGERVNSSLRTRYPKLVQITWDDIGKFLYHRFNDFPEKLPNGPRSIHKQWPDFGREYGESFYTMTSEADSQQAVQRYIVSGKCTEA
ncbi:MAG TPA: hypothetical protein V6C95_08185 [Coleofasciculaceae cyanobacterium]